MERTNKGTERMGPRGILSDSSCPDLPGSFCSLTCVGDSKTGEATDGRTNPRIPTKIENPLRKGIGNPALPIGHQGDPLRGRPLNLSTDRDSGERQTMGLLMPRLQESRK